MKTSYRSSTGGNNTRYVVTYKSGAIRAIEALGGYGENVLAKNPRVKTNVAYNLSTGKRMQQ